MYIYMYNVDHAAFFGGQVKHFTMYQPDTDKWKLTTTYSKFDKLTLWALTQVSQIWIYMYT